MKSMMRVLQLWLCICLTPLWAENYAQKQGITILATHGISTSLTLLARQFSAQSQLPVTLIFDTPARLVEHIEGGNAADVLIVEDPAIFPALQQQGVMDGSSLIDVAQDHVVLVAPKNSFVARNVYDTGLSTMLSHLFDVSLPVYADPLDSYQGHRIHYALKSWISADILAQRSIKSNHAQHSHVLVSEGHNPGFLYAASVKHHPTLTVISRLPNTETTYQAAVIAGKQMDLGRKWLAFLQSPSAQDSLLAHGYSLP